MDEPQTCGKGLAEQSPLPAKLGELTAAVAQNLATHMTALDLTDGNTARERDAYARLTSEHRTMAAQLESTATEMAGYRDLPMGRHRQELMAGLPFIDAFERFVQVEQELLALLETRLEQDREMLAQMRSAGGR